MLNLQEKILGDFDFYTRLPNEDEKKFYGIFISHSNFDQSEKDLLNYVQNEMVSKGLYVLCDKDFIRGGDDYQNRIENALDCYAAVVILTKNSIKSDWVNYEMGYLRGKGKTIYVWDTENLFLKENREKNPSLNLLYYTHYKKYGNIYNKIDDIIEEISKHSQYSQMFSNESAFLTRAEFNQRLNENAVSVIATLSSSIFDKHYNLFKDCKFGLLTMNFGMFYSGHGDGCQCYSKRNSPIENKTCPISQSECALVQKTEVTDVNKECVLLNSLVYSGVLKKAGTLDRLGNVIECGAIEYNLPVHKIYGTEFKFIIDVPNDDYFIRMLNILNEAGMNATKSISNIENRIYLSLPERRGQGLYRLDHEFSNNFICPYAIRKKFR